MMMVSCWCHVRLLTHRSVWTGTMCGSDRCSGCDVAETAEGASDMLEDRTLQFSKVGVCGVVCACLCMRERRSDNCP